MEEVEGFDLRRSQSGGGSSCVKELGRSSRLPDHYLSVFCKRSPAGFKFGKAGMERIA